MANSTATAPKTYHSIASPIVQKINARQISNIVQGGHLEVLADIIIEQIKAYDPESTLSIDKNRILYILSTYNISPTNKVQNRINFIDALSCLSISDIHDRYNKAITYINPHLSNDKLPTTRDQLNETQKNALHKTHNKHNINPFLLSQDQLKEKQNILIGAGFTAKQSLLLLQSFVCGNWLGNCLGTAIILLIVLWFIKEFGTTTSTSTTFRIDNVTYPEHIVVSDGESMELDSVESRILGFTVLKTVFKTSADYTLGYDLGSNGNFDMNILKEGNEITISNVSFPDTIRRKFAIDGPHDIHINLKYIPDMIEDQLKNSLIEVEHRDSVSAKLEYIQTTAEATTYKGIFSKLVYDPNYYRDTARAIAKGVAGSHSDIENVEVFFQNGVAFKLKRQNDGTYKITHSSGLENLKLKL